MQRRRISFVSGALAAAATLGIGGFAVGLFTSEFGILLALGAAAMIGIVVGGLAYLSVNESSS
jgi:hypothetical protein